MLVLSSFHLYILISLWMCLLFHSFINIFVLILTIQLNVFSPGTKAFAMAVETHAGTHLILLSKESIILDKSVTVIYLVNIDDAVWYNNRLLINQFLNCSCFFSHLDALKIKLYSWLILLISIWLIWWSPVCHNSLTHQDISYFFVKSAMFR